MIPGRNAHFMSWVRVLLLSLPMCKTLKRREEMEACLAGVRLSFVSDQQAPAAPTPHGLK